MIQQSAFLIKTLEKIGAPLAAAVEQVSARSRAEMEPAAREVEDAKIMAQLLGQTVQVSLSMGASLIQASDEEQADSLRLAVASMIAPLIAHHYAQHGDAPDDQALSRITKSLEASVAFAENFTPAYDQAARLSMLGEDTLIFDETQKNITVLDALVPVMKAIGEFPFGHSETKLLQDVSGKLKEKAGTLNTGGDALSEMVMLKSLAKIYADCHLAEVARLSQTSNEERVELSIDPVWKAFDTRLAMVATVLGLAPIEETVSSAEGQAVAPPTQPEAMAAPVAQAPATPAPAEPATVAAAGASPMSFFTPGGAQAEPAAAPAAPVAAPAQTEQVAQAAVAPTPPTETPAPAPAAAEGGGPMSFFKPGAKPVAGSETEQQ